MKKRISIILTAMIIINLSGCATHFTRGEIFGPNTIRTIYPATKINGALIFFSILNFPVHPIQGGAILTLNTVDLPISIITDTLFLPKDAGEINSRCSNSGKPKYHALIYKREKRARVNVNSKAIEKSAKELKEKNININEIFSKDDMNSTNENLITLISE